MAIEPLTKCHSDIEQSAQPEIAKIRDLTDWFYIPSWKRSPLPQPVQSLFQGDKSERWLVFVDECDLGEQLVRRLEQAYQDVTAVRIGEQFSTQQGFSTNKLSQCSYTMNPRNRDDYNTLLTALRHQDKLPTSILHLWSVTAILSGASASDLLENAQALGLNSLLFLAQAIGSENITYPLKLEIVSNNMQAVTGEEVLSPEKALLLGPVKVIPLEYANITCRSVDVVLPSPKSEQQTQLVDSLLRELAIPSADSTIAYRGYHRWVQTFEPLGLDDTFTAIPRLRKNGTYLVTGGLGNVGLTVARYLAKTIGAKLILVGRSWFPEREDWAQWSIAHAEDDSISRKIQQVRELEALGSEVLVVSADVAAREQMQQVLALTQARFGQIHGVIHAAGILGDGAIGRKTLEEVKNVLAPKVMGTTVLDALFKDVQLDFLVLFSSLSAIKPELGQVAYCSANNFLDAFAHRNFAKKGTLTTCINWDVLQGEGMAIDAGTSAALQKFKSENLKQQRGILPQEGIEVFSRILGSVLPQVLVSKSDFLNVVKPESSNLAKDSPAILEEANKSLTKYARPSLDNIYVAPRNEVEQSLADIWQELLGIEQIGIYDDFFELGGDSLFATRLISRLTEIVPVELSLNSIFETATIESLALAIQQTQMTSTEF